MAALDALNRILHNYTAFIDLGAGYLVSNAFEMAAKKLTELKLERSQ